jgi:hypothetical protein
MADDPKKSPAIDFYTFVLSLASSAFVHLGDAPHPETGQSVEPNLAVAHQTIDIIAMLQDKTRGNVTPEEAKLLEHVLLDLRLRYVEAARRGGGAG